MIHDDQTLLRQELKANVEMPATDLIDGLESLQNRFLLTKIDAEKVGFKLSPIFREYLKNTYR